MKNVILVTFLAIGLTSCKGSTEYGECIGLVDEGDPNLVYKPSTRNAVWTVLGFETIIAPILWLTDYAKCPVAEKTPRRAPLKESK